MLVFAGENPPEKSQRRQNQREQGRNPEKRQQKPQEDHPASHRKQGKRGFEEASPGTLRLKTLASRTLRGSVHALSVAETPG